MIEDELKDILSKKFECQILEVINESHLHAGHAGSPESGESHFRVVIVSLDFENLSRVARHQQVNTAVKHLFNKGLHALSLDLKDKPP